MPKNLSPANLIKGRVSPQRLWRRWWRQHPSAWQDRMAFAVPLLSVLLFMLAIVTVFWYLHLDEQDRDHDAMLHDVQMTQQNIRLRLIDHQERLLRLAKTLSNANSDKSLLARFRANVEAQFEETPELLMVFRVDHRGLVHEGLANPDHLINLPVYIGQQLSHGPQGQLFKKAHIQSGPVYSSPVITADGQGQVSLWLPEGLREDGGEGTLVAVFSLESLLQTATTPELRRQYAISMVDQEGQWLAGASLPKEQNRFLSPWLKPPEVQKQTVAPIGNRLVLQYQAFRTPYGWAGNRLFWLIGILSLMTAWMLIGNWRHTRRRAQAQEELLAETNFRRAMENSVLIGMRAMDMEGKVTYVNAAFCQMTGWQENELVGQTPPYSYWRKEDHQSLMQRMNNGYEALNPRAGYQMKVKRKDGSVFDARIYLSPLVDAFGTQTGWMSSMTDITEPTQIREQLSASYERFTVVLESLDAAVSVAPLGSEELLFANKLYRLWFGGDAKGHLNLVIQAGQPSAQKQSNNFQTEDADDFAGLPTTSLQEAKTDNARIYLPELGKWIEVRSRYLNWVDGRLAQMVICTDITQRTLAEEQAQAQAEQAQAASRLITMGEMASSVAHELGQPLTAINNYCNGMLSRLQNDQFNEETFVAALEKTAKQAQRAGQIIQRIRSFVKRSEPNRSPAQVAHLVEEAVELAQIEMRRRQVRLSFYVAARLPPLNVDRILIEQVLINLLKNAAEAIDGAQRPMTQREVELRVLPKQVEGQEVIEFSVSDTGTGLAPEVIDKIFDAFFTSKLEGMGIGLNLCRSIVESHDGRMHCENLYNGQELAGCQFSFWLPVNSSPPSLKTHEILSVPGV